MDAYRYNGVKLPGLPDWNAAAYPYACIQYIPYRAGGFIAHLRCGNLPFRREGLVVTNTPGAVIQTRTFMDLNSQYEWGRSFTTAGQALTLDPDTVIWSNWDIQDENDGVFLAASDPAPVVPVTIPDFSLFNWLVGFVMGFSGGPLEDMEEEP